MKNVALDSFIVSATPYEDLRRRYDDGTWDRKRFAEAHILFPERHDDYDYIAAIMAKEQLMRATMPKRRGDDMAKQAAVTQRAYTLRLRGVDPQDQSWRDALWATHEAVNKGAKAFGDWLLTLRGMSDEQLRKLARQAEQARKKEP